MNAHSYGAYGLTIQAPLLLPELQEAEGRPDVIVRFGSCDHPIPGSEALGYGQEVVQDGTCLFWKEAGHFLISGGREIVIDPAPAADERFLRAALLGPVLAALLHQRGFVVLHASGVALYGGAVGFMAPSGEGKSTTAGAFHQAGFPVIADDLLAVRNTSDLAEVVIGFPQLKLLPDALMGLGDDPGKFPRIYAGEEKRVRRVQIPNPKEALPLRVLYVLTTADTLAIQPVAGAEALKSLANLTFASGLLDPDGLRTHFAQCAALSQLGFVRRLSRPRDLSRLSEVIQAVKADVLQKH